VLLAQVLPRPQLIFPSKTWFFGIYLNFQRGKNHFKINISHILNPNLTKKIPLNPAHQDFSNNTTCTLQPIPLQFSATIYLIFSEEIIQYSRTFAPQVQTSLNQAHAPFIVKSFPKTPRSRT
jgi:hypothetical protein